MADWPAGIKNKYGSKEFHGHPQFDADLKREADCARAFEEGVYAAIASEQPKGEPSGVFIWNPYVAKQEPIEQISRKLLIEIIIEQAKWLQTHLDSEIHSAQFRHDIESVLHKVKS